MEHASFRRPAREAKVHPVIARAFPRGSSADRMSPDAIARFREEALAAVVQRAYARRIDVDVLLDSVLVDSVALALAQVRATPVVWIGDNLGHYDSMMIYGWVRDWDIVIAGPVISEARLTIEGLT